MKHLQVRVSGFPCASFSADTLAEVAAIIKRDYIARRESCFFIFDANLTLQGWFDCSIHWTPAR